MWRLQKWFVTAAWVLVLVFMIEPVTIAQELESEVFELGEIIVTAEQEYISKVATINEVTAEDIKAYNAESVAEALELLPGTNIRVGARGESYIRVRGFRQREALILIDGIPVNSPFTGQIDLSKLPVDSVSKITLTKGASSVLYGAGGMAAVINIVTKKGVEKIHTFGQAQGGREENFYTNAGVGGSIGIFNYFLSGGYQGIGGFPISSQSGNRRENSDRERKDGYVNLGVVPNEDTDLALTFNYVGGEYGRPVATIEDKDFGVTPQFERVDNHKDYNLRLAGEHRVFDPLRVKGALFFTRNDQVTNRYDDNSYTSITQKGSFHEDAKDYIYGGNLYGRYNLNKWGLVKLGLNLIWNEREANGFKVEQIGKKKEARLISTPTPLDVQNRTFSTGLEYELSPIERLVFVVGVSYDRFSKITEDAGHEDEWNPQFGMFYDFTENTRVRGSISRKTRFPSLRDLYDIESGESDLKAEKALNIELGVTHRFPYNIQLGLSGFYYDVDDLIEKNRATELYENISDAEMAGLEVELLGQILKNLHLGLGYTYLYTKDKSPGSLRDDLQYRPRHRLTWDLRYSFDFGLSFYLNGQHTAKQYFYSKDDKIKRELNKYSIFGIKASQVLFKYFEAYAGIDNITDREYEESYGYPQMGRFFYGGVSARF